MARNDGKMKSDMKSFENKEQRGTLNVKETSEAIILSWDPVEQAEYYKLFIQRGDVTFVENTSNPRYELRSSVYEWQCGESFLTTIWVDKDHKEIVLLHDVEHIVGGKAITDVIAVKDVTNPRRQITVNWKKPAVAPDKYKLVLYELPRNQKENENELIEVKDLALEQKETSHKFKGLKSNTTYCCKVSPIYHGMVFGGTESCHVQTDKRIDWTGESRKEFGQPENISHTLNAAGSDAFNAVLTWTRVDLSANYDLVLYYVEVIRKGWINLMDATIFHKSIETGTSNVEVPGITKGNIYVVKFHTVYKDLDTQKVREAKKEYEFSIKPGETYINNCMLGDGCIYFKWTSVDGAVRYELIMKDEFFQKKLAEDQTTKVTERDDGCHAKVPLNDKLGIGKICMTKVKVYAKIGLQYETDWKAHVIGGDKVPRNVKATKNLENPKRSARITFDAPSEGPADEYLVLAVPEQGRTKTATFPTSPAIFEYLRAGISYKFEVAAMKGQHKSAGSASNWIKTAGGHDPLVNFGGSGKYNFQGLTFAGENTKVNLVKGEDFGKVRNARVEIAEADDRDLVSLHWTVPSFDNRSSDYKVNEYRVVILRHNEMIALEFSVNIIKNQQQHSTRQFPLELDGLYNILITTVYEDIDEDCGPLLSNPYQLPVFTRPGEPEVTKNTSENNELVITWNAAKGAHSYDLEIFIEDSKQKLVYNMGTQTKWKQKLDEHLGYGMSYHAVVTAYSVENKSNSYKTPTRTIGGDYVPRNVVVSIKDSRITEPNTQVFLKWDAPKKTPLEYEVNVLPKAASQNHCFDGTTCVVSGLKGGTYYQFKVAGIHKSGNGTIKSGGCLSNKIQTDPKPTRVKNVRCAPGVDPSTSKKILWDGVDSEKEDETTRYRITVAKCTGQESDKDKQELYVSTEEATVIGLVPGASYEATVAGGNSDGFGRESEKVKFKAALAAPRNLSLNRMDGSPSNSVVLKFSEAGSGVENYTATLLKGIDSLQEVRAAAAVHSGHVYTNLEPNTAYVAKVQSMSSSNAGVPVMSEPVYTAPGKVQNVVVERCDINGNLIKATWNAAYICKTYEVQITRDKTDEALLRVDQPMCLHSCLGAGVTYHIRVRAHAGEIYGEWSEQVSITLVPGPVHIKSAKPVDGGIEVQWKGPARDVLNHRYIISLFTKAGRSQQERVSSEIANHRFKELLPGKQYFCSVYAENEAGCGLAEKSDWIKIPWVKPENFVVQLKPEDPSHEALFTWDHPDGVDGFKLVIDGPEFQRSFEIAKNEFLYTNGSPGTTYNCRLHNVCDGIYDSDAATLPQPLVMAPGPPTNIKVIPDKDPNQLQIQFDEPTVKPDRYEISALDVDENIEHRGDYISPYCQFTELQLGKKYKLLIQSVNGENLGSRKIASDLFETYPPKVQDLVLSSCCNESALVKWICPSQYIKRFIIQYKCGNKQFEQFTVEQEFKITGLKRSRVYHVTVAAENSAGQGEFSAFLEFQTALANLTHVKIHKSEHRPSTSLVVEIKDPDRKSKAYVITAKAKSDGTAVTQRTQQLTCAVSELRPGETYDVFVRAESGNKVSKTAYAPEPYMTIPDKVKDVQAESTGAERNIVRWSELPFPCSYRLRWKSATEENYSSEEVGLNKRFYEWELGLKPGTKYLVQVAGENRAGQGEWSDIKTFTTVGEQAESSDQGGSTTIFDGKVNNPAFFNHAQNVSTDSSTKMGDVKVLNLSFQGMGDRSAQNPALTQGPNDTRQAIMSAVDRFLDPTVPSTEIPSTSGISNQALCLTEEEDVTQNQDEETAPKRLGTVLGSEDEDRQSEEGSEDGSPDLESSMQHDDVRQSDGDESTAPLVCEEHERNEEERPAGPREQAPTIGRRLSRWFSCCIRGHAPDNDQQSDALLQTDRQ